MFKQSRFFFSAALIAVLFVSTLILTKNVSARKRCPVEPPKTLLSLYLGSDTVVLADLKREDIIKPEAENTSEGTVELNPEPDYYVDINRTFEVVKTFKGAKKPSVAFRKTEYRPPVTNENPTDANKQVEYYIDEEGSFEHSALQVGKRYLVFLSRDTESEDFYPTDYRAAGREITPANAGVYEKRLKELGKIIANKKNQIPNITEWLVQLSEDEATRWDGTSALARSYASIQYEVTEEEAAEQPETGEKPKDQNLIDENFGEHSPAIAKSLTAAQKERLSAVMLASLNKSLYGGEKKFDYDYALAELVGNWDKTRFAIYGFGALQGTERANTDKTRQVMSFVADMIDDEQLSAISYEYYAAVREPEVEQSETAGETPETEVVTVTTETAVATTDAAPILEKTEADAVKVGDNVNVAETDKNQPDESATKTEELSPAQIREEILQRFMGRYQELLARDFTAEPVMEVAETNK